MELFVCGAILYGVDSVSCFDQASVSSFLLFKKKSLWIWRHVMLILMWIIFGDDACLLLR